MKKEEIHWLDWHRILLGTAPELFLVEVLVRTIIIYLFLLVILRLLGKRMGGQLTISELAVMLTLGAIISIPMQVPDKGLAQGFVVLICALFFQRGVNYFGLKSQKFERLLQGRERLMVKNGVMMAAELLEMKMSREQMAAVLRAEKIFNLGEVRRVYIEADGLFSIFKYPEARPGLSLLPPADEAGGSDLSVIKDVMVCSHCGNPAPGINEINNACSICTANEWTPAVIAKK
ncbi:MAG: YetF domain-containing protein [Pedobacter sp.]